MLFPFQCQKCDNKWDGDYPIGKAPRVVPCPSCGGAGKRVYAGLSIGVKVGSFTRPASFGEQMKARNAAAGHRMKGRKPPVRLAGYQMPDGKVVGA